MSKVSPSDDQNLRITATSIGIGSAPASSDQPTIGRENRSTTAATQSQPSAVHIREISDPAAVGGGRFERAVEHAGSDGGDLPLTQIGAAVDAAAASSLRLR
jgi:hypothetical protein